jgi:hypothetical protein
MLSDYAGIVETRLRARPRAMDEKSLATILESFEAMHSPRKLLELKSRQPKEATADA